ncbi:hypothetical protein IWZ03DRAFT_380396 [Phyllosticta citriasiana]|uniref:Uncharacterized protein n=1 Tax=Phyllosticta citriasiana TaxID=595635 RepID=A0ABR1KJ77_9PEZI
MQEYKSIFLFAPYLSAPMHIQFPRHVHIVQPMMYVFYRFLSVLGSWSLVLNFSFLADERTNERTNKQTPISDTPSGCRRGRRLHGGGAFDARSSADADGCFPPLMTDAVWFADEDGGNELMTNAVCVFVCGSRDVWDLGECVCLASRLSLVVSMLLLLLLIGR